jgi:hypothetical protein
MLNPYSAQKLTADHQATARSMAVEHRRWSAARARPRISRSLRDRPLVSRAPLLARHMVGALGSSAQRVLQMLSAINRNAGSRRHANGMSEETSDLAGVFSVGEIHHLAPSPTTTEAAID